MNISKIIFVVAVLFSSASLAAEIDECDRLATNPPDPDGVTTGVPRAQVDLPAAIAACSAAVKAHPDNARFAYQLGRVYYYSGDYEKGISYISRSADMGYRQGEFVMGAIVDNRRPGVTYDMCTVEDYWYRSAVQGHLHARVAYVRHLTKGRFDQCTVQASNEQVVEMIDITAKGSSKYFLRLLVEDLKEDVAAYLQDK